MSLRSNDNLFDEPLVPGKRKRGLPKQYSNRLRTPSSLAWEYQEQAQEYTVNLYGKKLGYSVRHCRVLRCLVED